MKSFYSLSLAMLMLIPGMKASAASEVTLEFVNETYNAEVVESITQPVQVRVTPADAIYTVRQDEDDTDVKAAGSLIFTPADASAASHTYPVIFTQDPTAGQGIFNMVFYTMSITETTAGTYALTVNEGAFVSGDVKNKPFTHTWVIEDKGGDQPGDADIEPQMILPYGDEVEAPFESINIMFPYNDGDLKLDLSKDVTLVNNATQEEVSIDEAVSGNAFRITMKITENGTYTLTVPAATVRNKAGKNLEIVKSWTVTGGTEGITSIEADSDGARYYDLNGVEIANPERGATVIRVANGKSQKLKF